MKKILIAIFVLLPAIALAQPGAGIKTDTTLKGNGSVTSPLGIDPANTQSRVTGTCSSGSAIREIKQDGTVTCQSATSFTTNNVIPKGNGSGLTASSWTDDGTTSTTTGNIVVNGNVALGTTTLTSAKLSVVVSGGGTGIRADNSSTGKTADAYGFRAAQTGSFDTTSGTLRNYGIAAQAAASRSAGANDMINFGLYGTASSGTVNYSIYGDAGTVVLNATSGNTCIGTTSCSSKLWVRNGSSGLTPIGNTIVTIENTSAHSYLSFLNNANDMGIVFGNSTANNDGYILYTSTRSMVLRSQGSTALTLTGANTTASGSLTVFGNSTLGDSSARAHAVNGTVNFNSTAGTEGQVLTIVGGLPKWATASGGGGGVSGTGTAGRSARWVNTGEIGDGALTDDGTNVSLGGTLTVTGAVDINDDLVKVGSLIDGATYIKDSSINFEYGSDSDSVTGYISRYGYNGSTSRFRNTSIRDGKNGEIVLFTGSSKLATFRGAVSVTDTLTANSSLIVNGSGTVSGYMQMGTAYGEANGFACARTTNAAATCHISKVGYNNSTGQVRHLQINDGTGDTLGTDSIAFFNGTDHSTTLYGIATVNKQSASTALASPSNTVMALEQADGTDMYLHMRGTGNKYLAFGNASNATDGYIWFSTSRNMLFGVLNQPRMLIDASGPIRMGDGGGSTIGNNVDVLVLGNTGTGQTAAGTALFRATHTGSFNTSSGAIDYYGGNIDVSATRSAGSDPLTAVALSLSATGADTNIGLFVRDGFSVFADGASINNSLYVFATTQRGIRNHYEDNYYEWNEEWLNTLFPTQSNVGIWTLSSTATLLFPFFQLSAMSSTGITDRRPGMLGIGVKDVGEITSVTTGGTTTNGAFVAADGTFGFESTVLFPQLSNDAGVGKYNSYIGFAFPLLVGCGFAYMADTSNKFLIGCGDGSGNSTLLALDGSGGRADVTVTADTWYRLGVEVDDTNANFYVDGTLVGTITTDLPANFGWGIRMERIGCPSGDGGSICDTIFMAVDQSRVTAYYDTLR